MYFKTIKQWCLLRGIFFEKNCNLLSIVIYVKFSWIKIQGEFFLSSFPFFLSSHLHHPLNNPFLFSFLPINSFISSINNPFLFSFLPIISFPSYLQKSFILINMYHPLNNPSLFSYILIISFRTSLFRYLAIFLKTWWTLYMYRAVFLKIFQFISVSQARNT